MKEHYYHMFANGDDARNFIIVEEEFKAAFNRMAVCSYLCGVTILAFSIEDSHPHSLIRATEDGAHKFKAKYEDLSIRYIARHRRSTDGVNLQCELCRIDSLPYLMNAASYVIVQATKDGKAILPYDYLYGTGGLYFRKQGTLLPWDHDFKGDLYQRRNLGDLPIREQWHICNTKLKMPQDWVTVNGFIHPACFIDITGFESIFKTHNCFRAFLASGKARDEIVRRTMASTRGITIEDIEARKLCQERCLHLFGHLSTKHLTASHRLTLAQDLRKLYALSYRQLSTLTKLPEEEIRKYIR